LNCRNPHAWNSGAAKNVGSRARRGIAPSTAAIGSTASGWPREAPFGVPVLPDVSSVILPGLSGASSGESAPRSIKFSTVSPRGSASCQAIQRLRSPAPSPTSSSNSSS
jgi:hypothetical protein